MTLTEKVTSGGQDKFWIILDTVEEDVKALGCFSASWLRSSAVCVLNMSDFMFKSHGGETKDSPGLRQTSVQRSTVNLSWRDMVGAVWGAIKLILVSLVTSTQCPGQT